MCKAYRCLLLVLFGISLSAQPANLEYGNSNEIPLLAMAANNIGMGMQLVVVDSPGPGSDTGRAFYVSQHAVTRGQWDAIMGNSRSAKSKSSNETIKTARLSDALEFCRYLSRADGRKYRLLTEADWNYLQLNRNSGVDYGFLDVPWPGKKYLTKKGGFHVVCDVMKYQAGEQEKFAHVFYDEAPKLVSRPGLPSYPLPELNARSQGSVLVALTIGEDGMPKPACPAEGPAPFQKIAVDYFMRHKFEPTLIASQPVPATQLFEMHFFIPVFGAPRSNNPLSAMNSYDAKGDFFSTSPRPDYSDLKSGDLVGSVQRSTYVRITGL